MILRPPKECEHVRPCIACSPCCLAGSTRHASFPSWVSEGSFEGSSLPRKERERDHEDESKDGKQEDSSRDAGLQAGAHLLLSSRCGYSLLNSIYT